MHAMFNLLQPNIPYLVKLIYDLREGTISPRTGVFSSGRIKPLVRNKNATALSYDAFKCKIRVYCKVIIMNAKKIKIGIRENYLKEFS